MENVLRIVKKELEQLRCPKHHKPLRVEIVRGKLEMTACCDDFKKSSELKYRKLFADSMGKYIKNGGGLKL